MRACHGGASVTCPSNAQHAHACSYASCSPLTVAAGVRTLLCCVQLGSEVHGILLWPLGGLAFMGKSSSPQQDLMVAGAGPLTHIPQVGVLAVVEVSSRSATAAARVAPVMCGRGLLVMQFAFWAGSFFVVGSTVDEGVTYPVLAAAVSHGLALQLYDGHFFLSLCAAAAKVSAEVTPSSDAAACAKI